jgi:transposase
MRGSDARSGELFSYVDLEKRVPANHPLRLVRRVVNDVLAALDRDFSKAYADGGRPSIPPERLLRALLLQAFYTRSLPKPRAVKAERSDAANRKQTT